MTIPAGTLSVTVPVHVFGDLLDEPDETFTATLSAPVGAAIGDGQLMGTIVDDDPPPAFSVNDVSIVEGNLGTTPMEFKVALSSASAKTISVAFATAATGATKKRPDRHRHSHVQPRRDTQVCARPNRRRHDLRADRDILAHALEPGRCATLADGAGVGTILNDDAQSGGPTTCTINGTEDRTCSRALPALT